MLSATLPGVGAAVGGDIKLVLFTLLTTFSSFAATSNAREQLTDDKLQCNAAPRVTYCLECKGPLAVCKFKRPTFVYHHHEKAGAGTLYQKKCSHCNLTYELDGYTNETGPVPAGQKRHTKVAYAAEFEQPDWD